MCSLLVRMSFDFASDALPLEEGRFMPTRYTLPYQKERWGQVLLAGNELFDTCVEGMGMPGWASVTTNIVVAFWPRGSEMERVYGAKVLGGGGEWLNRMVGGGRFGGG